MFQGRGGPIFEEESMSNLRLVVALIGCIALPVIAGQPEKFELLPAGEGMLAPPGFKVSLIAAEPLVNNPAAMTVAPDGRIFVCEDYVHAKVTPKCRGTPSTM
jgi:hypothetical protein